MAEKLPSIMIERPKMPRATWEALRSHIIRERQRKKLELEQNAEYERQKKLERENKKKQEALTLEETKEQIAQLEAKLNSYKSDKHELFHTLKKVLHDDETRRRAKEAPHPSLYLQPNVRPLGGLYMKPHSQLLIQQAPPQSQPVKRQRSPSPPRSMLHASYYRNSAGPSVTKYAATSSYSVPTTAHTSSHYTSYPGSAVVSVGNHLSHEQEEAARAAAAKHIYLNAAAAASAGQQAARGNVYSDRDRLPVAHHRGASGPPAAHSSAATYRPNASTVAGSIMTGYPRFSMPNTTSNSVTLASSISSSPRMANGSGHPGHQGHPPPGQRYYTGRD